MGGKGEAYLLCSGHPFCDFEIWERVEVGCGGSLVTKLNSSAQTLSEPGVLSGEAAERPREAERQSPPQALKI